MFVKKVEEQISHSEKKAAPAVATQVKVQLVLQGTKLAPIQTRVITRAPFFEIGVKREAPLAGRVAMNDSPLWTEADEVVFREVNEKADDIAERMSAKITAAQNQGETKDAYIGALEQGLRQVRLLQQDTHEFYAKLKARTDCLEALSKLVTEINNNASNTGKVNWAGDARVKELLDQARALGVNIPEGKYEFTLDERKLLKEDLEERKTHFRSLAQTERLEYQHLLSDLNIWLEFCSQVLKSRERPAQVILGNFPGH